MEQRSEEANSVQVVLKAVALVDALAEAARSSRLELGVSELSRQTGISKPTVHRLLTTLVEAGLVAANPVTRKYGIGSKVFEWEGVFLDRDNLTDLAREILAHLRDVTLESASLHVRIGNSRTCIAQAASNQGLRRVIDIGSPRPLWTGSSGIVLMTGLSDDELATVLNEARKDAASHDSIAPKAWDVAEEVERTRACGYCVSVGQVDPHVNSVATTVRGHTGSVEAALVVSGPAVRLTEAAIADYLATLQKGAAELSASLGWRPRRGQTAT